MIISSMTSTNEGVCFTSCSSPRVSSLVAATSLDASGGSVLSPSSSEIGGKRTRKLSPAIIPSGTVAVTDWAPVRDLTVRVCPG